MPALVTPLNSKAIPLRPEFVVPQDGHEKQDCEIAAAKRWLQHLCLQTVRLYDTVDSGSLYSRGMRCILGISVTPGKICTRMYNSLMNEAGQER